MKKLLSLALTVLLTALALPALGDGTLSSPFKNFLGRLNEK
jgi:hypothetical protein